MSRIIISTCRIVFKEMGISVSLNTSKSVFARPVQENVSADNKNSMLFVRKFVNCVFINV